MVQQTWQPNAGTTVEDFDMGGGGGAGNFTDMFEQFFGAKTAAVVVAGGRRQPRQPAPRGGDIEHPVTLTFEQAARGTMLPLQIETDGKTETIEIKIPAGVKDGSRIRIRGRGRPGTVNRVICILYRRFSLMRFIGGRGWISIWMCR